MWSYTKTSKSHIVCYFKKICIWSRLYICLYIYALIQNAWKYHACQFNLKWIYIYELMYIYIHIFMLYMFIHNQLYMTFRTCKFFAFATSIADICCWHYRSWEVVTVCWVPSITTFMVEKFLVFFIILIFSISLYLHMYIDVYLHLMRSKKPPFRLHESFHISLRY